MNNEPENNGQGTTGAEGQEKTFTQEDVNRIVGERLARAKNESSPGLQEREQEINKRELMLDAREKLMEAGLSKDLLSALNCNSKEEMEKSIEMIKGLLDEANKPKRGVYRAILNPGEYDSSKRYSGSTDGHCGSTGSLHADTKDPASIRAAMGLKG